MKVGLITTTINVPRVLELYRAHDPDVRFFVAMDKKTPEKAWEFCENLHNCHLCRYHETGLAYACDDLIGWNTIARRNIALLEALKWGAELIVSIDDDNIPLNTRYFEDFTSAFDGTFYGIKAQSLGDWFDPASLCFPRVVQRGFPQHEFGEGLASFYAVTGARIGVAQGMILGDPDTSAVDRISQRPEVHQVSELLRAGIVADPKETYAPVNSQNIAFIRELAPCFLMVPAFGRYDDIYAGLVAQRVMRECGLHVGFGRPFVWQQRNPHDLLRDLAAEQWGAEHILKFAAWLDVFTFTKSQSVIGMLRVMFTNLPDWMPERGKLQELGLAWLDDAEGVL
jgi:hypothetical protein